MRALEKVAVVSFTPPCKAGLGGNREKKAIMADKFAGQCAVITGGSTGIGLATAKRFVQEAMESLNNRMTYCRQT
jgi:hypothetical protein